MGVLGFTPEIWVPIKLTVELAAITTLSLLVVATPIAWWLARLLRQNCRDQPGAGVALERPLVP